MKMMKNLFLSTLLLLSLFGAAQVSAEAKKTIFYNLTTDEAWRAGMALGQAGHALKHGYGVVVFLNVRGVYIADKAFASDGFGGSGKGLQEMLKGVMSAGGKVIICPMCMKKAGISKDRLIDGVIMGGPSVTMPAMTADDTVVMSY